MATCSTLTHINITCFSTLVHAAILFNCTLTVWNKSIQLFLVCFLLGFLTFREARELLFLKGSTQFGFSFTVSFFSRLFFSPYLRIFLSSWASWVASSVISLPLSHPASPVPWDLPIHCNSTPKPLKNVCASERNQGKLQTHRGALKDNF